MERKNPPKTRERMRFFVRYFVETHDGMVPWRHQWWMKSHDVWSVKGVRSVFDSIEEAEAAIKQWMKDSGQTMQKVSPTEEGERCRFMHEVVLAIPVLVTRIISVFEESTLERVEYIRRGDEEPIPARSRP